MTSMTSGLMLFSTFLQHHLGAIPERRPPPPPIIRVVDWLENTRNPCTFSITRREITLDTKCLIGNEYTAIRSLILEVDNNLVRVGVDSQVVLNVHHLALEAAITILDYGNAQLPIINESYKVVQSGTVRIQIENRHRDRGFDVFDDGRIALMADLGNQFLFVRESPIGMAINDFDWSLAPMSNGNEFVEMLSRTAWKTILDTSACTLFEGVWESGPEVRQWVGIENGAGLPTFYIMSLDNRCLIGIYQLNTREAFPEELEYSYCLDIKSDSVRIQERRFLESNLSELVQNPLLPIADMMQVRDERGVQGSLTVYDGDVYNWPKDVVERVVPWDWLQNADAIDLVGASQSGSRHSPTILLFLIVPMLIIGLLVIKRRKLAGYIDKAIGMAR